MKTTEEILDHISYNIYSLRNYLAEIQNGAVNEEHLPLLLHDIGVFENLINFIKGEDENN